MHTVQIALYINNCIDTSSITYLFFVTVICIFRLGHWGKQDLGTARHNPASHPNCQNDYPYCMQKVPGIRIHFTGKDSLIHRPPIKWGVHGHQWEHRATDQHYYEGKTLLATNKKEGQCSPMGTHYPPIL